MRAESTVACARLLRKKKWHISCTNINSKTKHLLVGSPGGHPKTYTTNHFSFVLSSLLCSFLSGDATISNKEPSELMLNFGRELDGGRAISSIARTTANKASECKSRIIAGALAVGPHFHSKIQCISTSAHLSPPYPHHQH